jgi:hypothetical protein
MGLNFSTVPFGELNPPPLINTAHLFTDSILIDSVSWVRLSGSFIADSAYQYLGIGNYFDDSNTDTINTSSLPFQAYYYIDDICVSTDSLFNEVWTGTLENETINQNIETFPNPAKDKLNISAKTKIEWIRIINLQGVEISNFKNIYELNFQIDVSNFKPELYFVNIKTITSFSYLKILIKP